MFDWAYFDHIQFDGVVTSTTVTPTFVQAVADVSPPSVHLLSLIVTVSAVEGHAEVIAPTVVLSSIVITPQYTADITAEVVAPTVAGGSNITIIPEPASCVAEVHRFQDIWVRSSSG